MDVCSACGATENLRSSLWHTPLMICRPCFLVWYDPPVAIDRTSPDEVGKLSRRKSNDWDDDDHQHRRHSHDQGVR